MNLVFNQDAPVAAWVSQKIGSIISPPFVTIGVARDGMICAGVVFNDWNGYNIECTLASNGGITRGFIRAMHNYMFTQIGAIRATAQTRRSNKTMRAMLPRFGFQFEGVRKRFFGPTKADDAFVYVMFPEGARRFL